MDLPLLDVALGPSSPVGGLIASYILAQVWNGVGRRLAVTLAGWRYSPEVLWEEFLPRFLDVEEGTQTLVGAHELALHSELDREAARSLLIPGTLKRHRLHARLPIREALVSQLPVNQDRNLILYGGWIPSELAASLFEQGRHRFRFGLKEQDRIDFAVKSRDLPQLRNLSQNPAYTDRWVVGDVFKERVICDSTQVEDGAIIVRTTSPLNSQRQILAFMGTGAVGTYLASLVIHHRLYAHQFHKALYNAAIGPTDPFEAVVRFRFKYKPLSTLSLEQLKDVTILFVERL